MPWGVVTNKPAWLTNPLMENLQLAKRAACIVSGDTIKHAKPNPEPLLYACNLLQVDPKNCVYIGDAKRDIDAGNSANMTTITALYGYIKDLRDAKNWSADYAVNTTIELKHWIKTWLANK
jgi:phosphoglycolate phosphatase